MSTSSIDIQVLLNVQSYILYFDYIIFVVGIVGNSLNLLLFTKLKLFRNNRCTFYLIVESLANIVTLIQYFIPQIFQLIYGTDPINLSIIWCKTRTTLTQSCRLFISSVICLEAFDQYLSTHQLYSRQLNTLRHARYLIWINACIWFCQTIPYIIYFEILPGFGCVIINTALLNYYSYVYYIFLNGLIPISISSLFSLLAYRNVRHIIRLRIPMERRRLDHQMTAMIFVRVIVFVVLLTPYTIFRIYILNMNIPSSDGFRYEINQVILMAVGSIQMGIYSVKFLY